MLGPHPSGSSFLDSYSVRILLGLVASLSLLLLLVNVPLHQSTHRGGWSTRSSHSPPERIALSEVQRASPPEAPPSVQIQESSAATETPSSRSVRKRTAPPTSSSQQSDAPGDTTRRTGSEDISYVTALGPNDEKPKIIGGMGALYHNIEYPEKARKRGIEGHLTLEFTVQTDGSVTDVEVVRSLHAVCDSAAIAGLRSVRFAPAAKGGTKIPVRLRLPVEFRLVSVPSTAAKNP